MTGRGTSRDAAGRLITEQAAAMLEAGAPAQALAVMQRLRAADVASYQPYWVTRAHVLAATRHQPAAQQALQRAIGLTDDPAVRAFLAREPLDRS